MVAPAQPRLSYLAPRPLNRTAERIFYGIMTLLMVGTVLLGFRASYFPLGPKPPALSSPIIAVHGVLFTLYLGLFLVQVALISARRVRWHMSLGLAVYGLAVLMLPLGVLAAADEIRRDLAAGPPYTLGVDPLSFSIVSVMGMVMFGSLLAASYLFRRKPQIHKRLALYATLSMMDAGCDRWPWETWGISHDWSLWVYTGLLLLPVAYDVFALGRPRRLTLFAASYIWILHKLEIPIGHTAAWHHIASFMLKHMA